MHVHEIAMYTNTVLETLLNMNTYKELYFYCSTSTTVTSTITTTSTSTDLVKIENKIS